MTNWKKIEETLLDLLVEVRLAQRPTGAAKTEKAAVPTPGLTTDQIWNRERKSLIRLGRAFRTAAVDKFSKIRFTLGESGSRYTEYTLFIRVPATNTVLKSVHTQLGYNLSGRSGALLENARRLTQDANDGSIIQLGGIQYRVIKK